MIKNNLKNKLKQAMYKPKKKEKENILTDYFLTISKDIDEAIKILKNVSSEEDEAEETDEESTDKKDTEETKSDDKKA